MNPDEFLGLASRLLIAGGEAEYRTAVSRAYYGVFHQARLLVESCGVRCPASGESHSRVAKCLQNCGNNNAEFAGRELDSLRSARNDADYRLADGRYGNANHVQLVIRRAQRIRTALLTTQSELKSLRGQMRAYAKDILKLQVDVKQ